MTIALRGMAWTLGVCAVAIGVAAAAAAPPPAFQPYADPDRQFTIRYPAGWHVKRGAHVTSFYLDDPDEGTGLTLYLPPNSVVMRGELTASQVFGTVVYAPNHKRYPDFTVGGHEDRVLSGNPNNTMLQAVATWTNSRHVKMRGYVKVVAFKNAGERSTWVHVLGFQGPADAYGRLMTTFGQMVKSLTYGPGR